MIKDDDEVLSDSIAERIQASMGELTPAQKKVARTLISHYPIAGLEPMTAFAERAGVSAPTVMRFVNRLGFGGYPSFQAVLREEVQERLESPVTQYQRDEASEPAYEDESVLQRASRVFETALSSTFSRLPESEYRQAVEMLSDVKRQVHCIGGRFSRALAGYLYRHLYHVRPNAQLVDPEIRPIADALVDVNRRDIVVVFDYRRYQPDVVAFAHMAAQHGASIILLTDPWLSPVADVAEVVLAARVEAPSPYDSFVAPIAVLEALVAGIVVELGAPARSRVEALEREREKLTESMAMRTKSDGNSTSDGR